MQVHSERRAASTEHRVFVGLGELASRLEMLLRNGHLQDRLNLPLVLLKSVPFYIRIIVLSQHSLIFLILDNLVNVLKLVVEFAGLRLGVF